MKQPKKKKLKEKKTCVSCSLYLTSKIRAIRKFHCQSALSDDAADSVLNEVHFLPDGALSYNIIMRLEYLKAQLGQHGCDKVWLRVGKQRHGRHQLATVEVYNFLREDTLFGEFKDSKISVNCVQLSYSTAVKCLPLHT